MSTGSNVKDRLVQESKADVPPQFRDPRSVPLASLPCLSVFTPLHLVDRMGMGINHNPLAKLGH